MTQPPSLIVLALNPVLDWLGATGFQPYKNPALMCRDYGRQIISRKSVGGFSREIYDQLEILSAIQPIRIETG